MFGFVCCLPFRLLLLRAPAHVLTYCSLTRGSNFSFLAVNLSLVVAGCKCIKSVGRSRVRVSVSALPCAVVRPLQEAMADIAPRNLLHRNLLLYFDSVGIPAFIVLLCRTILHLNHHLNLNL